MDGAPLGLLAGIRTATVKRYCAFLQAQRFRLGARIELNPRPLFGLDKLAAHPKDKAVFIVEVKKARRLCKV